jgi:pilus assembly protein CpaC
MRHASLLLFLFAALPLRAVERLTLYAGESKVLDLAKPQRLIVGDKALLEARALDDAQVLVTAKAPGQTSLLVWDRVGQKQSYEVEVLNSGLRKALVEVDVQVLEIAAGTNWDLGLDYAGTVAGQATVAGVPASPLGVLESSPPPLMNWGSFQRGPLSARLDLLVQKNKARVLAKPRLVTMSGGKARFLSGGQIPVAQADRDGRTSTQYKDYGVSLEVAPKADEDGNVNADVRAELSDIDAANSVSIGNGGVLPAIKSRWVETSIFVKKDSTLVLAGLLQETQGTVTAGVPVLSEIPLLGELFKHHKIEDRQTELVIFLTPKVLQ